MKTDSTTTAVLAAVQRAVDENIPAAGTDARTDGNHRAATANAAHRKGLSGSVRAD